jgi:hypothetical protein
MAFPDGKPSLCSHIAFPEGGRRKRRGDREREDREFFLFSYTDATRKTPPS